MINLSNISVVNKHRESIYQLLPLADLIFAKEKEALALVPDVRNGLHFTNFDCLHEIIGKDA